jgi:hypothetical protein
MVEREVNRLRPTRSLMMPSANAIASSSPLRLRLADTKNGIGHGPVEECFSDRA